MSVRQGFLLAALSFAGACLCFLVGLLVAPLAQAATVLPAAAPAAVQAAASAWLAIVVRDQTALRAGPHEAAPQQAQLWQGEVLEVRGEKLDHLQVWDYRRERGGFVEASRVRRASVAAADAPELMAVVRFVRETPGAEALGIGFAAAYLEATTPEMLRGEAGAEAFDAIGTMADRLAHRASAGGAAGAPSGAAPSRAETALAAHLEVAARYGLAFKSYERDGAMRICYDGEAFRHVLAMPSSAAQRARAALGLTRPECIDPQTPVSERPRIDAWRAEVLDRVDEAQLPKLLKNRVAMRRASVWSSLAYQHARRGEPAAEAAQRALAELATVERGELADDDLPAWNDAAIRVGASRWAAAPQAAPSSRNVGVVTAPGDDGQTCVSLVDAKHDASAPLVRRCTFGIVWAASATLNREGNALALAVQPMDAWRELWLFRKQGGGWVVQVLPPSTNAPALGYAEFAGWVPGGRLVLVARESRGEHGLKRSFEVVRLDSLVTERQTGDASALGPFMRWQDAAWKRETVSVR
jgi:hypothetical protein